MSLKHVVIIGMTIVLAACTPPSELQKDEAPLAVKEITLVSPQGARHSFTVEIADNDEARQKGLMFRTNLEANTGMLFVFDVPGILAFWMKNTEIPLDILFFDAEMNFVSWASMEQCVSAPCPMTKSKTLSQYALEVPVGTAERLDVKSGWKLEMK